MSTIDVTKLVRDVQESTMQQAFYLQSKAFFEKNNEHINEIARLKAEVERLRKAGDAMAETLEGAGFDSAMDFWNAANREQGCLVNPIKVAQYLPKPPAKEGKQS